MAENFTHLCRETTHHSHSRGGQRDNGEGWTRTSDMQWRKNLSGLERNVARGVIAKWKGHADEGSQPRNSPRHHQLEPRPQYDERAGETSRRPGNSLEVSVMFSDRSRKYKGRFHPEDTIYDVISEIKQETGKNVQCIMDLNTKRNLQETMRLRILHETDLLRSMVAVLG